MNELKKTEKLNLMFAYYEKLLTEKQQEYFKMYYYNDYSLTEIAELFKVSRNAVYDQLKRVEDKLIEYEDKLGLVKKSEKRRKLLNEAIKNKDFNLVKKVIEMDD